jgi:UDPglucose 6-dehydrogenase
MKITVLGLWHLGSVTAACCAEHFDVVGLDFDADTVAKLNDGKAPLFEPGLDALIEQGLGAKRLRFTQEPVDACRGAEILWVAFDTPVNDEDRADTEFVLGHVRRCVPLLPHGALVLLSSQLPVGTVRSLEQEFAPRGYRFACAPENLRLGKAIQIFTHADRVVVGSRDEQAKNQLATLFAPFTSNVVWMGPESAEMTKHAINSFLALSITFMNELSCLCERTGADAKEVERGLKSESRIGPGAYLSPGGAFAGGTLARDVLTCIDLGERLGEQLDVFPAIKTSNDRHRRWASRKLALHYPIAPSDGSHIALLGLTYKPGTDTLRRSSAVELARWLRAASFSVAAYDPVVRELPADLGFIRLFNDLPAALQGAAALVLCTEWPEFRQRDDWAKLVDTMRHAVVVDATRFLSAQLTPLPQVVYLTVGSPA